MWPARLVRIAGVITMLLGAAPAGPAQTGHPEVSRAKLQFQCQFVSEGKTQVREIDLSLLSPQLPGRPDQEVALPEPYPPIRVVEYLPWADLKQEIVPDASPEAGPVMLIAIEGPKLRYERGLVANDPARNRLTSLIGFWRYAAAADREERDEYYRAFEHELSKEPRIVVQRRADGASRELPVEPGKAHALDDLGCTVRILEFDPNFVAGQKPSAASDPPAKRLNPAVRLEVEWDGNKEEWLVFSRFPEFNRRGSKKAPYRIRLDCPLDVPQRVPHFAIVTVGRFENEVWTRFGGEITSREFGPDARIEVPGSKYVFRQVGFSPAARIRETYELSRAKRADVVLKVETLDARGEKAEYWLKIGRPRTLDTQGGPVQVRFGQFKPGLAGAPEREPKKP